MTDTEWRDQARARQGAIWAIRAMGGEEALLAIRHVKVLAWVEAGKQVRQPWVGSSASPH